MTSHPSGSSVLVVSAELTIRQTRVLLLEEAGHTAQAAESAVYAKKVLPVTKFDLVLLDHTLARDDRLDLIQFIRELRGNIRVLLLHKSGELTCILILAKVRTRLCQP